MYGHFNTSGRCHNWKQRQQCQNCDQNTTLLYTSTHCVLSIYGLYRLCAVSTVCMLCLLFTISTLCILLLRSVYFVAVSLLRCGLYTVFVVYALSTICIMCPVCILSCRLYSVQWSLVCVYGPYAVQIVYTLTMVQCQFNDKNIFLKFSEGNTFCFMLMLLIQMQTMLFLHKHIALYLLQQRHSIN